MEENTLGYHVDSLDVPTPSSVRYETLSEDRAPYVTRANLCADATIKMYNATANNSTELSSISQGHGTRCVKNLASKINLTLMPPDQPFFKYQSDAVALLKEDQQGLKTALEEGFLEIESALVQKIEASKDRAIFATSWQRTLVSGNILYHTLDSSIRAFPLHKYVVERDFTGRWTLIIVEEEIKIKNLPEEARKMLSEEDLEKNAEETVKLYTTIELNRETDKYIIWQELNGRLIEGTNGSYNIDGVPWIPARLFTEDNAAYSRSFVEEHLEDLEDLAKLNVAQTKLMIVMAKIIFLVKPASSTNIADVKNAKSGDIIQGNEGDITTLQASLQINLNELEKKIYKIEQRLNEAFLMGSSIQREGERVTATEFRYMAQQLEERVGGLYSTQAQELQRAYIQARYALLEREGKLPALPEGLTKLTIVTGYEALGRSQEGNKLVDYVSTITQLAPQTPLSEIVNVRNLAKRLAIAMGVSVKELIPSEEEIAAKQEQEQMAQMAQSVAPNVVNQLGQQAQSQQPTQQQQ